MKLQCGKPEAVLLTLSMASLSLDRLRLRATISLTCLASTIQYCKGCFPHILVYLYQSDTFTHHLEINGAHDAVLESVSKFDSQINPHGVLFMKKGLSLAEHTKADVREYALEEGDYHSSNLRIEDASFVFDLVHKAGIIADVKLTVPGFHNVENAVAAGAVALELGVPAEAIRLALNNYRGVRRRFEYVLKTDKAVLIDDYAHHPAEVMAFLSSVKALYPDRELTAIFQPHLFSRTRDFADGFAESLSIADHVLLLDIYPARELPIEGVTSDLILRNVQSKTRKQCNKAELPGVVREMKPSLLVTIGAGDIDQMLPSLKSILEDQ